MIGLYTPDQVRAMDQRAFDRGVEPLALMERAAGHLARGVVATAARGYGLRVAIFCGKGNNGGDGLAAARRLRDMGATATVQLVAGGDELSGDAAEQLRRWQALGGRLADSSDEALRRADIAVDCLLGTGASGEPRSPYAEAVEALNAFPGPVVACDLPTGVDADTGQVPGTAVRADLTVTPGAHKRGLHLWPARGYCGDLLVGDLGIVTPADAPVAEMLEGADLVGLLPQPSPESHKRSRGVVVVLAGFPGMSGAATLVAKGALAAGAGLVTVATGARDQVAPTVPEALTLAVPAEDPDTAFELVAGRLEGADALAVGPGLGHDKAAVALVRRIVAEVDLPLVLDADGINAFRHEGEVLAQHASRLLTITPHAREFARLVGSSGHGVWAQRVGLVPEKAADWQATIVAKGPGSMVAAPDGRVWVNPTGGPALATGGTGDVLTGMTAALVAERAAPESVAAAVWLHGLAGDLAARTLTPRSVTAVDVAGHVPDALRLLEQAVP